MFQGEQKLLYFCKSHKGRKYEQNSNSEMMVGREMYGGVCDFVFLNVPIITGRKPAHMQFAHQPLIVSDCCHSHSKTIRSERRKTYHKGIHRINTVCTQILNVYCTAIRIHIVLSGKNIHEDLITIFGVA